MPPPIPLSLVCVMQHQGVFKQFEEAVTVRGGDCNKLAPTVRGGVQPHKIRSSMHDNCSTARAGYGPELQSRIDQNRSEHFTAEELDALPKSKKTVIDLPCLNHGRCSCVAEYRRKSDAELNAALAADAEPISAVLRVDLNLNSVVRVVCKALRWSGADLYAKGFQYEFLSFLKDKGNGHSELAGAASLGRGELGSRFDTLLEVCSNLWVYMDAATGPANAECRPRQHCARPHSFVVPLPSAADFLAGKITHDTGGIMPKSMYTRLTSAPFLAEMFGCVW